MALASLEAEPVAYIFKHPAGKLFWALTDESNKEQPDVIPVYAAAPASVVPDNASEPLAYAYKELTPEIMRNQAAESNRGNEWTGNPDIDNAIIMLDRIDTLENCDDDRIEAVKAVLRRLAGNYPVTPDGWISCSERMPNDAQWCVVNTKYGYYVQCWSEGQGWLGDDISIPECDVINWMPLPEPPQEVNRG
ncbi:putative phage protein [Escherichia coli]|nr:putative phage protein [Escherichia coli]